MTTSFLQKSLLARQYEIEHRSDGLSFKFSRKVSSTTNPFKLEPKKLLATPYLMSPALDLLFVCGFAPWLIGAIFFFISAADRQIGSPFLPQQSLATVFIVASLLIGESHQFTSIIRYYTTFSKRDRRFVKERIPIWTIYASLAIAFTLTAFNQSSSFLSWAVPFIELLFIPAVIAFPAVLLQHVCAQAISISQIYCRNAGYAISPQEKEALSIVSWCLTLAGTCSIAIPFGWERIPEMFFPSGHLMRHFIPYFFATAALVSVCILLRNVVRRGVTTAEWPPITATLLMTNLTLFTLLPLILPGMAYVFLLVPLLFHATQHWALAWHTHVKETKAEPTPTPTTTTQGTWLSVYKFALPILSVTLCVLFLPIIMRRLSSPISPLQFGLGSNTLSVFFSMIVFYLHYFADRIVWRAKSLEGK